MCACMYLCHTNHREGVYLYICMYGRLCMYIFMSVCMYKCMRVGTSYQSQKGLMFHGESTWLENHTLISLK